MFVGHRERGQVVGAQLHLDVAAGRQRQCVVDRVGHVGEQLGHLLGRFKVLLGRVFLRTLGIVQDPAGGDADPGLVGVKAVAVEKPYVVAGDQRQAALARVVDGEFIERRLVRAPGAGQLQMQAIAENAVPVGQPGLGQFGALRCRQPAGQTLPPGQCKQTRVVLAQPIRPQRDAVGAVSFHPHPAEQARQGQIAGVVTAEQGQSGAGLVAIGQADIGAQDRLDAGVFGLAVELHRGEQVVDVRQRDRWLAKRHAAFYQLVDPDGGVDKREFAVQVQVGEACGHSCRGPTGWGNAQSSSPRHAGKALTSIAAPTVASGVASRGSRREMTQLTRKRGVASSAR